MRTLRSVDLTQLFNLLTGMVGIYVCYFIGGLLHEDMYASMEID